MPSAPIVPPGSWPCRPSTPRLSRSSQPSSRRISHPPRNPLRPATPRGIVRSHPAATPLATPAKRRAIFINQSDHHNQSKTPISPRLLNPTRSLRINQQGVRFAHVRFELPPLDLMVPPRGPVQGFCCGARLARVEAPAKEGWGCTPYPAFRARSLPLPHSTAERVTCHHPYVPRVQFVSQNGRRPEPRCPLRFPRTRGLRRLDPTLGSPPSVSAVWNAVWFTAVHTEPASRPTCSQPRPALPSSLFHSCSLRHPNITTHVRCRRSTLFPFKDMANKRQRKRQSRRKLSAKGHLKNARRWLRQGAPRNLLEAYVKRYPVSRHDAHVELHALGCREQLAIESCEKDGIEWEYKVEPFSGNMLVVPKGTPESELPQKCLSTCAAPTNGISSR